MLPQQQAEEITTADKQKTGQECVAPGASRGRVCIEIPGSSGSSDAHANPVAWQNNAGHLSTPTSQKASFKWLQPLVYLPPFTKVQPSSIAGGCH
mmetsp:Transcript_83550/g.139464  ORF Transcript_83550/g.139464 Transcript_83550/m.139464 type:complete len:95 (+) Transcript_83550:1765-2049(+)